MPGGADTLPEENAKNFHSTGSKLFWVMNISLLDTETTISLLCTRVKDPDIHNWLKLRQLLQSFNQTIGEDFVIGYGNIYEMLTCVETSYATYNGMRGHTGGCMTFG